MTIKARFVGSNSLGYVYGSTYSLRVNGLTIMRKDKTGICEYSSLSSFLRSWDNIEHEQS